MSYIGNEPIVSATRTVTEVTATAGQTVFTANGGYTVGFLDVFINGSKLTSADFTATDGSTVTLTEAAQVNDIVRLEALGTFQAANAVLLTGNSNLTGNLNVSGNLGVGTTSPAFKLDVQGVVARVGGATAGSATAYTQYGSSATDLNNYVVGVETGSLVFYQGEYGGTSTERMRIGTSGQVGIGGANYGTSGQVLTSGGASSAPSWADAPTASTNFGGIGSYVVAFGADNTGYATGATVSGSSLTYRNAGSAGGFSFANNGGSYETMYHQAAGTFSSLSLSGTWRCMSGSGGGAAGSGWRVLHLWVRVS